MMDLYTSCHLGSQVKNKLESRIKGAAVSFDIARETVNSTSTQGNGIDSIRGSRAQQFKTTRPMQAHRALYFRSISSMTPRERVWIIPFVDFHSIPFARDRFRANANDMPYPSEHRGNPSDVFISSLIAVTTEARSLALIDRPEKTKTHHHSAPP